MKNVKKTNQNSEYKKYLQELEDPNYSGGSWMLSENATPLEQAKYDICKKIVSYQQDNNLSIEEITQKIQLSKTETENILYYRIDYFTLDRLVSYATRLLKSLVIKIDYQANEKP